MTLSDLEAPLPWGFHDAYLEGLTLDWPRATLTLTVRVMITEHQDMDQRASILITGLVFCAIDAPVIDRRSPTAAFSTGSSSIRGMATSISAGVMPR